MQISFDPAVQAFYFRFVPIPPGAARDTLCAILTDVQLTESNEIAGFTILNIDDEGKRFSWSDKLKHVGGDHFDGHHINITFPEAVPVRTLRWDCNLDVDGQDQIVGVEMLFAEGVLPPRSVR